MVKRKAPGLPAQSPRAYALVLWAHPELSALGGSHTNEGGDWIYYGMYRLAVEGNRVINKVMCFAAHRYSQFGQWHFHFCQSPFSTLDIGFFHFGLSPFFTLVIGILQKAPQNRKRK